MDGGGSSWWKAPTSGDRVVAGLSLFDDKTQSSVQHSSPIKFVAWKIKGFLFTILTFKMSKIIQFAVNLKQIS